MIEELHYFRIPTHAILVDSGLVTECKLDKASVPVQVLNE